MRRNERSDQLLGMLASQGSVKISTAVDVLGVSEATARRLFAELEKTGKAVRCYGGIKQQQIVDDYSFERVNNVYGAEKRRIGRLAAKLVESGDSIYLDCGTTVMQMAEALSERVKNGEIGDVNIITNSVMNLNSLRHMKGCRVISLGGEYNYERRDFSGSISEKCMEMFQFKKCFLGTEGWTELSGFASNHPSVSSMNAKAIGCSDKRFVLMDHSKFGLGALVSFAKTSAITALITDAPPIPEYGEVFASMGVSIITQDKDVG